jgi:hypothetical protein
LFLHFPVYGQKQGFDIILVFFFDSFKILGILIVIKVGGVPFDHFFSDSSVLYKKNLEFGRVLIGVVEPANGNVNFVVTWPA